MQPTTRSTSLANPDRVRYDALLTDFAVTGTSTTAAAEADQHE